MEGTCINCGLLLAAGDTYCGNCGQPTPAVVAAPANAGWPDSRSGPMPTEAAVGQRTPNAQYLGLRLVYDKVPEPRSTDAFPGLSVFKQVSALIGAVDGCTW